MKSSPAASPRAIPYQQTGKPARVIPHPSALRQLGLAGLPKRKGHAAAPLVWLYLCSRLSWGGAKRDVHPSVGKIAQATGLHRRSVQYALRLLEDAGKVSSRWGRAPKWTTAGRIYTLHFEGPNPRVLFPGASHMRRLWALAKQARKRPTTTVALAVACYVWAAASGRPSSDATTTVRLRALEELTASAHGSTFRRRLAVLEQLGILRRAGSGWRDGITVVVALPAVEVEPLPEIPWPEPPPEFDWEPLPVGRLGSVRQVQPSWLDSIPPPVSEPPWLAAAAC